MSDARVKVAIRVRPVLKIDKVKNEVAVQAADETTVVVDDKGKNRTARKFDHVFSSDDGQARVFETLGAPMLQEAYEGFNVCLFAYGQTGSGKTYSLLADSAAEEEQGLAPRFVRQLFAEAQRRVEEDGDLTVKVSVSMIEVYMERVRDLLSTRARGQEPESLEIHEDPNRRVYVKGAGKHIVMSAERLLELLRRGNANRQVAETRMNETSSRSHAIVQITLSQEYDSLTKKDLECCISLVDLAGSERQTKTESAGQSFEEAKKINHSLLMLGRALNSFSDRKGGGDAYVSLRESKLTRLLSESFGGNSKTWMLATVSPTVFNLTETISTLEYASNAMAITNKVRINKAAKSLEMKQLKVLVSQLESRLESLATAKDSRQFEIAALEDERDALSLAVRSAKSQRGLKEKLDETVRNIRIGNEALKTRLQAVQRGVVWELDNEVAAPFFKGRCGLSLRCVLCGARNTYWLGLQSESGQPTKAKLKVQLFPVSQEDVSDDFDDPLTRPSDDDNSVANYAAASGSAGASLSNSATVLATTASAAADPYVNVGKVLQFCLRVIEVEEVPPATRANVFCTVTLRQDPQLRTISTKTVKDADVPRWDLVKYFELVNLTHESVDVLCNQDFFTFEVFGFAN